MEKKKLLGVAMAALMVASLAGCAGGNKASAPATDNAGTAPTTMSTTPEAMQGMDKATCSAKEGCSAKTSCASKEAH